jgi:hypothetical protein
LLVRLGHGSGTVAPSSPQLSHLGALELLEQHGCLGEWHYGRIEDIAAERFPLILHCGQGAYCLLLAPPRQCHGAAIQSMHGGLYLLCHPGNANVPDASAAAPPWCFGALGLLD